MRVNSLRDAAVLAATRKDRQTSTPPGEYRGCPPRTRRLSDCPAERLHATMAIYLSIQMGARPAEDTRHRRQTKRKRHLQTNKERKRERRRQTTESESVFLLFVLTHGLELDFDWGQRNTSILLFRLEDKVFMRKRNEWKILVLGRDERIQVDGQDVPLHHTPHRKGNKTPTACRERERWMYGGRQSHREIDRARQIVEELRIHAENTQMWWEYAGVHTYVSIGKNRLGVREDVL